MPTDDETTFDDGSDVVIECEPDEPPKSGEWVDSEEMIASPTAEELSKGERLGWDIDINDDTDNGGV